MEYINITQEAINKASYPIGYKIMSVTGPNLSCVEYGYVVGYGLDMMGPHLIADIKDNDGEVREERIHKFNKEHGIGFFKV